MTDLNDLRIFAHVARSQSFTEAAVQLNAPKSHISRAVARLEERLGVRLVERTTRRVTVTEAGNVYLGYCTRMLEEAEQADAAIGKMLGKPRGLLRVAAPIAFVSGVLSTSLSRFLAAYPEVRVELEIVNINTPLRQANFDVLIHAGPLTDSGLLVRRIMQIRVGLYASPAYIAKHGVPESPSDLRHHHCISTNCGAVGEHGDSAVWRLRSGEQWSEVRVNVRACVPEPSISRRLAVAGVGIALINHAAATEDVNSGALIRVLSDHEPDPVELHALHSARLDTSPKVRAFVEFLRQLTAGLGDHLGDRLLSISAALGTIDAARHDRYTMG